MKVFNHLEQAVASRKLLSDLFNADFQIAETYTL